MNCDFDETDLTYEDLLSHASLQIFRVDLKNSLLEFYVSLKHSGDLVLEQSLRVCAADIHNTVDSSICQKYSDNTIDNSIDLAGHAVSNFKNLPSLSDVENVIYKSQVAWASGACDHISKFFSKIARSTPMVHFLQNFAVLWPPAVFNRIQDPPFDPDEFVVLADSSFDEKSWSFCVTNLGTHVYQENTEFDKMLIPLFPVRSTYCM